VYTWGNPANIGKNASIFSPFYGFSSKWRLKLLPIAFFISDLEVKAQKFKNYLNGLQKLFTRNFSIVCGNCGLLSRGQKLTKSVFKIQVAITF